MKYKALAAGMAAFIGLVMPAAAGAKTLIGSGSVAAQPVLEALFHKYEKVNKGQVKFVYTANGGNAGVQDVQNGTSQFAGQARPPLPSDAGTTYMKMYLDGLCIDVNPANKRATSRSRRWPTSTTADHQLEPGAWLGPRHDDRRRSAVTRTEGRTTSSSSRCSTTSRPATNVNALTSDGLVANAVKRDPNAIGYFGLAWQGKGVRRSRSTASPARRSRSEVQVPAVAVHLHRPPDRQPEQVGDQVHRLGAEGQGGRRRSSRRPAACRVQQGVQVEVTTNSDADQEDDGAALREAELLPRFARGPAAAGRGPSTSDRRVELWLGALVCGFVGAARWRWSSSSSSTAWPSFAHNGLAWFGPGGNVDEQFRIDRPLGPDAAANYVYTFHAWPLIWSTILITGGAVAHRARDVAVRRRLHRRVRARVDAQHPAAGRPPAGERPSVIYGLLGVLVIVPFIGNDLITETQKASVAT